MSVAPHPGTAELPAIELLGPLRVLLGGAEQPVTARKRRVVLTLLALEPGSFVSDGELVDAVWGERAPATAEHAIAVYVSELRRVVGPWLRRRAGGYVLEIPAHAVDVGRFELGLAQGRSALAERNFALAAAQLAAALALFRGEPLADVPSDALELERRRLRDLRVQALEDRLEADLALGRHLEVIPELERLAAAEPLRERLLRLLMLALYRAGRQADALARYRAARRWLRAELGLEPTPALSMLERAILTHDPTLQLAASAPAAPSSVGWVGPTRRRVQARGVVTRLWLCSAQA